MKNLLQVIAVAIGVFWFGNVQAQCTVDPTVSTPGMSPVADSIPCIVQGQPFDFTLDFKNFNEVTAAGNTITIDSIIIDSIANIPCGIGWVTNKPDNRYFNSENGCIRLAGVTNDPVGQYRLRIIIDTKPQGSPVYIPNQNSEVLGIRYDLRVVANSADPCPALDTTASATLQTSSCYIDTLPPVGIASLEGEIENFVARPNPFSHTTEISFSATSSKVYNFQVIDVLGQKVYEERIAAVSGRNYITFERRSLSPGVYFYSLNDEKAAITRKMIIEE